MTRTTITILTICILILTMCSAREEEEGGRVRDRRESVGRNVDRRKRETLAGKGRKKNNGMKKGNTGRKNRNAGRKNKNAGRKNKNAGRKNKIAGRKNKNAGRKNRNSGRKNGNVGKKNGNTGIKKGNIGRKKEMSKRKKMKLEKKKASAGRKKEQGGRKNKNRKLVASTRKEMKFSHCQYLDLTEIGLRNDSACEAGSKFLFKAQKGHRRQFLMTNTSNIVVFLKHRHKITNCTQLTDITDQVKCKAVAGTKDINIPSPIGGCLKSCNKFEGGTKPSLPPGNATQTGSATTVFCPCPERRTFVCSTKVVSTGNTHTITCNNMASVTLSCGSDLVGAKNVLGLSLDYYKHKLCSTKEYKSILIDYTWRCKDKSVPVPSSPWCKGDPVPAPTSAPTTAETTPAPTTSMVTNGPPGRRRGRGALSSGKLV